MSATTTQQLKDQFIEEAARLGWVSNTQTMSDSEVLEAVVEITGYPRQLSHMSVFAYLILDAYTAAQNCNSDDEEYVVQTGINSAKRSAFYG